MTVGPLSPQEERIWLLDRIVPGTAMNNLPFAYDIRGDVDVEVLSAAFQAVVARHDRLRTRYCEVDGSPMAKVVPWSASPIEVTEAHSDAELAAMLATEAGRPFDVAAEPLLRVYLFRRAPARFLLLLVVHHLVADAHAIQVILRELGKAYAAGRDGRTWDAEPPAGYEQYAMAQHETTGRPADHAFWRKYLRDAPTDLATPQDRPRTGTVTYRSGVVELAIDVLSRETIDAFGHAQRVSLFMTLAATWVLTLHRHGAGNDIVIGTPISNRHRPVEDGLVGLLMDVMPLRATVSPERTFAELLTGLRRNFLKVLEHSTVPLVSLIANLGLQRRLDRTPLFQTLCNLIDGDTMRLDLVGLACSQLLVPSGAAQLDLELGVVDRPDGSLLCRLTYKTDLYDRATAEGLLAAFERLLLDGCRRPETRVVDLSMLDPAQRAMLRAASGSDSAIRLPAPTALDLIARQVSSSPDAPAIVSRDTAVSYRELHETTERLAGVLRRLGAAPGTSVVLHLPRSVDLVLCMVATWKTGASCIPVDPTYPPARVRSIIDDAAATFVVTADVAPETNKRVVTMVDCLARTPSEGAVPGPPMVHDPNGLAYIAYTSGSTGRPKGVAIAHRSLVNVLTAMAHRLDLSADDVMLWLTSPAFDITMLEVFLPLSVGGSVVIATPEDAVEPTRVIRLVAAHGVTTVQATPAGWRWLLAGADRLPRLRRALCGGDALPEALARQLCHIAEQAFNLYGPTETTVWSLAAQLAPEGRVTLGRPIGNTTAWVLDRELNPVPFGVPGELYLGGAGLAQGYHGQPGVTARSFVPDPFGRPGDRLYRTGDLVRLRREGNFDFVGRVDRQRKLRGFRIELGEVESVLRAYAGVREAVALVRQDRPDQPELVAYVVVDRS